MFSKLVEHLEFVGAVPEDLRESVEQVFFFNPRQGDFIDNIRAAVQRYGMPEIVRHQGLITIDVPERNIQALFALDRVVMPQGIAAIVMFRRTSEECLSIAHLAVNAGYDGQPDMENPDLAGTVIREVCRIGQRINGVRKVELPYRPGCFLRVEAWGKLAR